MSEYVRIAAIDIGSDTVHLLIADVTASSDGPLVSDIEQRGELIELDRRVATMGQVGKRAATRLEEPEPLFEARPSQERSGRHRGY